MELKSELNLYLNINGQIYVRLKFCLDAKSLDICTLSVPLPLKISLRETIYPILRIFCCATKKKFFYSSAANFPLLSYKRPSSICSPSSLETLLQLCFPLTLCACNWIQARNNSSIVIAYHLNTCIAGSWPAALWSWLQSVRM